VQAVIIYTIYSLFKAILLSLST